MFGLGGSGGWTGPPPGLGSGHPGGPTSWDARSRSFSVCIWDTCIFLPSQPCSRTQHQEVTRLTSSRCRVTLGFEARHPLSSHCHPPHCCLHLALYPSPPGEPPRAELLTQQRWSTPMQGGLGAEEGTLGSLESPVRVSPDPIHPGAPGQVRQRRACVPVALVAEAVQPAVSSPLQTRLSTDEAPAGRTGLRPRRAGGGGQGWGGGRRLDGLEAVPEGLVWSPIRGSFIHISLPRRSNKKYLVFWPPASQRRAGSMPLNA